MIVLDPYEALIAFWCIAVFGYWIRDSNVMDKPIPFTSRLSTRQKEILGKMLMGLLTVIVFASLGYTAWLIVLGLFF